MAQNELALGKSNEGLQHLRQALELDPRSVETATRAVYSLAGQGRYTEALQAASRALALAPDNLVVIHAAVEAHLTGGDLPGARAVIRAAPREVDPAALVASIASWDDLYWVLDDAQQRLLLRLSPASFSDDRAWWAFALAQTYASRGDSSSARAYADSARLVLTARLREAQRNADLRAYLGMALAYMGRKTEAIREGQRALELVPSRSGPELRGRVQHHVIRIYLQGGEVEKALDLLESLNYLTPGWLRIDPAFAPLRGNPRFERLVRGS
jgi:serine/threonine-protein kinase